MRFLVLNCLLLASVVVALPNARHKRDLSFLKNLITSKIFGRSQIKIQQPSIIQTETNYRLFRLPGYDNIMIKVSPKSSTTKEFIHPKVEPVNLNAFGSVVGTNSTKDTIVAVKEVNNMLTSGILTGKQNNILKETIVPMFPELKPAEYVTEEKIESAPVIETRAPVLTEVRKPAEEKVELKVPIEPQYSYTQMEDNGAVLTYTAHNNPNVKVMEEITETALPTCVKNRVDEAIMLAANPNRLAPVEEIYQYQSPPVMEFVYPRVETDVQDTINTDFITEGFGTVARFGLSPQPIKLRPFHFNARPIKTKKAINPHPLPLHSNKSPHLDIIKIRASKDKTETKTSDNSGENLSEYITNIEKKDGILKEMRERMDLGQRVINLAAMRDIASESMPSYIYNIYSRNPNTGKNISQVDRLKINETHSFVPVTTKTKTLKVNAVNGTTIAVKVNPQKVHSVGVSTNPPKLNSLKEMTPISLTRNPKVVADVKNYSYKQKNADGSSLHVNGDKHGVTVNIKENKNKGRGDIPDQ